MDKLFLTKNCTERKVKNGKTQLVPTGGRIPHTIDANMSLVKFR